MSARAPLDVDLEDKLLYGLTPTRLAYVVVGLLMAFGLWSSGWAPGPVRGFAAACVMAIAAGAAWGRWRGRAVDTWVIELIRFLAANRRLSWHPRITALVRMGSAHFRARSKVASREIATRQ